MTPQTILLVDDNAIQAMTRRSVLQKTGRTVAIAGGAEQALAMLEDGFRKSVGLVITDHLMPGMNGPEFVAKLRERMPSIPVIVLSGYHDVEPEYAGLNVIFRAKPVPPEELIALSQSLLPITLTKTA